MARRSLSATPTGCDGGMREFALGCSGNAPARPSGCCAVADGASSASLPTSTTPSVSVWCARPNARSEDLPSRISKVFARGSRLGGLSGASCTPGRSTNCASSSPTRRRWRECGWSTSTRTIPRGSVRPADWSTRAIVRRRRVSSASAAASLGALTPSRRRTSVFEAGAIVNRPYAAGVGSWIG